MRFTVLIPTYNNGPVIGCAIESVLEQTLADFELFVVADGAPEQTHAVVESYAARDPRIRLFKFPKGERHGEAWRHAALAEARSDAVCYLSDDDFWFPDHLETMHDLLAEADFAHTRHTEITPAFTLHAVSERVNDNAVRRTMLENTRNFFGISAAGHRLDNYRRLPEGWSAAPPDVQTDLHMWRKWLRATGVRFAASRSATSMHFARVLRPAQSPADMHAEVSYWRQAFKDPSMLQALRDLLPEDGVEFPLHEIAARARAMREENATQTKKRADEAEAELERVRNTATWRFTAPLRALWRRMRR